MKDTKIKKSDKLNPSQFEEKWQDRWMKERVYQPDMRLAKRPFYNLMMFPYPSAEGLHVGNVYAFTGADIYGRFQRMKGNDVFEPIGLDGFGIHSENYAIKIGKHPKEQAKISEKNFYRQLKSIGNGFAWENRLETYDPDYYRWTQWIFVAMFKHNLAYRKKSPVNFCPKDKTVLSDEQVIDGKCERCGAEVEKKEMEQWFFKISAYAERLLQNTYKPSFAWSEKVKIGQRNWIGKKEGINITYPVIMDSEGVLPRVSLSASAPLRFPSGSALSGALPRVSPLDASTQYLKADDGQLVTITCFTTRPDTNFGATFVVIGPEHPFSQKLQNAKLQISNDKLKEIKNYVEKAKKKSEQERIAEGRKKTGVFTGFYAVNQLNSYKMPIFISDFVLGHVGTGAVVGVPGHDIRDFEFAKEFDLPIVRVVVGKDRDESPITKREQIQEEEGTMINSGFLDGKDIHTATKLMMNYLEEKGWGKRVVTYKLRDWCISRQRYWGAPIPMINCPKCGWVPVSDEDLPVLLPDLDDWKPEGTGKGPLAKLKDWVKVKCPKCGGQADRETDVCDTFLDSSWYHMRYPSLNNDSGSVKNINFHQSGQPHLANDVQLPVSRSSSNPPSSLNESRHSNQLGKTRVNNKSTFNSFASGHAPPLNYGQQLPWDPEITKKWLPVNQYIGGAEHTVLHLLYARFVAMAFNDWGLIDFDEPYSRFFAHGLIIAEGAKMSKSKGNVIVPDEYIKAYGADTLRTYLMFLGPFDAGGDFRDTGIAGMYKFLSRVWRIAHRQLRSFSARENLAPLDKILNRTIKEVTEDLDNLRYNTAISKLMEYVNFLTDNQQLLTENAVKVLLLLMAPFAPHMTEELYQNIYQKGSNIFKSIHSESWPTYDPKYLIESEVTIVVQVNGKVRETIKMERGMSKVQKDVEEVAKNSEKIKKHLEGKEIKKVIFVPVRLINFVI